MLTFGRVDSDERLVADIGEGGMQESHRSLDRLGQGAALKALPRAIPIARLRREACGLATVAPPPVDPIRTAEEGAGRRCPAAPAFRSTPVGANP